MAQGLGIAKKGFGMVAKAWHMFLSCTSKKIVLPKHGTGCWGMLLNYNHTLLETVYWLLVTARLECN